ncbi:MAG TPA: phosphoribosylformylglycinamidine synthase [Nitrospirae bacterium]|nr:phosphoribosylformylglycinamidine synthase [bacterium BMS3Abin06]HDH10822.1 phosphoribosylformylglycinamidine synthase [Nitrospirota bacterium]HDZ00934.1 phosphoribosylformylglycinamidine synthase [Nitrospirota bacterium]
MDLIRFYRTPALSEAKNNELLSTVKLKLSPEIEDIKTEFCFYIEAQEPVSSGEMSILSWLLSETFEPENFSGRSFLIQNTEHRTQSTDTDTDKESRASILEVGPRMNFTTAWSTNAVSVCHACGLQKISRIERSRRYKFIFSENNESSANFSSSLITHHSSLLFDRMTECPYPEPLTSFETGIRPEPVFEIPLKEEGKSALEKINKEMGLGLDDWDIEYYYDLFVKDIGRNPTNVECFDLSQSNSEHSRHWFFKGKLIVDDREAPHDLIELIKKPLKANPNNSVIAFNDNSSSIRGYEIQTITTENPRGPAVFKKRHLHYDIIFTAETHNFPSGVAPFPGAETGTGGRIRDVQATGRGGLVIAGTAAYSVGNLLIPGYELPWEDRSFDYPANLASPLEIEIQASNGASDYGNKFGEPVIQGFTRSFGARLLNGERYEWIKPIMFTAGVGQMDARHIEKGRPEKGMLVLKIGGPAYRIGIGGGAASSMIQGENIAELDFNAVQRGDAEMEQKMNRVLRACIEMGDANPIISIHDQGAGGNCNVVKEIIYPAGAKIEVRKIQLGDNTLSVLEIWGAEYQEQNALLLKPEDIGMFEKMCLREKVLCAVIGEITGDGYAVLYDGTDGSTPVNLDLEKVLGDMPQKTFHLNRISMTAKPLELPKELTVRDALERVLRLLSVGSKRFLTNKVDRSVTGLIAQQQCVGPIQLTVSDVAVVSQSHFGLTGAAISIGEQPLKTLLNPAAMARLCVGEALTNIVWAKISALEDIKCSGNWMWAAKLPGEGAKLYDAAVALSDILIKLGIAIDGGKDSLSMAAQVRDSSGNAETVKSPGTLVISAYATCPDITKVITPDIKRPGQSRLIYIYLGNGKNRLGGSALAQVYNQLGSEPPDVDDPELLKRAFNVIQDMIEKGLILSGHDRSDGGLITTLLEMAFAGNCGMEIEFRVQSSEFRVKNKEIMEMLFSEELGLVIEYLPDREAELVSILKDFTVPYEIIGKTVQEKTIQIKLRTQNSELRTVLNEDMRVLKNIWEETSWQLERLQANPESADEERKYFLDRPGPDFKLSFDPEDTPSALLESDTKPKVAVIREEGSNSDREMTSAFFQAGFDPWDITMTDFLEGRVRLSDFKGAAFVGGFSYADVLDSAKGWAGVIRFNKKIWDDFQDFYNRKDTFSLGVCNGCQLMALLGWVPWQGMEDNIQPRFIHNRSGRFESRFSSVKILPGPSIMLKGMEGSVLGIWIAHGEGRAYFPDEKILGKIEEGDLAQIRYVDDNNEVTMKYPFNPNGSAYGIASLCSPDGRHLAIMPHPERTFLKWQWSWMPEDWKRNLKASPWLRMFQNARKWSG